MAEVVTLEGNPFTPEEAETAPVLHRPSDMLRTIADEIDKGEHGEVHMGVVVIRSNTMAIFGIGKDAIAFNTIGLLHTAAHKIEKDIIE